MDKLLNSVKLLCYVLLVSENASSKVTSCKGWLADVHNTYLPCSGLLYKPVCLLCNTSRFSEDVSWFVQHRMIAYSRYNLDADHAGGLVVNGCPEFEEYSLMLRRPATQNHNKLYFCQRRKRNVSAFLLTLHADSELSINSLAFNGKLLWYKESTQVLQCIISSAVPPFVLSWWINNIPQGKKTFNTSLREQTTAAYNMTFGNLKTDDILTCSSEGMFLKGDSVSLQVLVVDGMEDNSSSPRHSGDQIDGHGVENSTLKFLHERRDLIIAAGVVLVVVIIFLLLIVPACYCFKKESTNDPSKLRSRVKDMSQSKEEGNYQNDPNNYIKMTRSDNVEFPRENLRLEESIGSGAFAIVYKAEAYSIINTGQSTVVAVKTLKDNATENDRKDFMAELALFKTLGNHENVVTMYGCCTDQDPVYLIMEYIPNGNLQQHLRSRISINPDPSMYSNQVMQNRLASSELLGFCIQIANGMEFLVSKQCVHRDLAARNILLGENNICKIADFGLARDVAERQEYEMRSRGRVPVRWLSPESLLRNVYTEKSDIWSFGIVMWEIITLGSHPYPGMNSKRVLQAIRNGYRLPRPDHCDDEIYAIVMSCWKDNPADRPNFVEIRANLERLCEADQGYLQMDNFHQDKYLYLEPDVVLAQDF